MPGVSVRGPKLAALHASTSLPDYWGGHHLPHVAVPVHREMTFKNLKQALNDELYGGCVMGADAPPENDAAWFRQARIAVGNIEPLNPIVEDPEQTLAFPDLEPDEDDDVTIYAYFVFTEAA